MDGPQRCCDVLRMLLTDAALLATLIPFILGIYVGAEVSYGAYVLVYSHARITRPIASSLSGRLHYP